jgi:glycosyltransferase involved in cell wall biosynthesis
MPEDDRDSGSRRVLHLVEGLQAAGWAVTFVSHHANPSVRHMRALQQRGVDVYAGAGNWMDPLIATQRYDLMVFALWDIAEPYLQRIRSRSPRTRVIVDSIDLHFLRNARRTFQESGGPGVVAALGESYASEMIRELNTYAAADGVFAVSQKEADLINDLTGNPSLAHAVLDGEDLSMSAVPFHDRRGLVFIGCYRFPPNVKAVEYLCRDILPRVDRNLLAQHPVYIVGDGLNETVRAFGAGLPYVRMVGWVPSVAPYLDRARVSVVPLVYGAGTKRKVLQAVMQGTPTVSTSVGVEGLGLTDREHVLVADSASAFADAITEALTNQELWERLRANGHAHVSATHGRDGARAQLQSAVAGVLDMPPKGTRHAAAAAVSPSWDPQRYHLLRQRITDVADRLLPPDADVLVFSKGDEALVQLGGRSACHFPQGDDGRYAGWYPADTAQAVAQLEKLRARGFGHVLLPSTALWWFDHYRGLTEYFEREFDLLVDQPEACRIYGPRGSTRRQPDRTEVVAWGADSLGSVSAASPVRLIAFLLPQFHPIPENDQWWGHGFTEWTNVMRARPLFDGHYQPHVPADLGFYDLRLSDARAAQASLASRCGLHGFCYYHYWFDGKLLLNRPFDEVLRSGEPDFPFCLCWANEPWTRRWDGKAGEILQAQSYGHADDLAHIRWLMPALADRRAITIDGKPLFLVYQAKDLPDPARTVDTWREQVHLAGLPGIYLMACETGWDAGWDATSVGFDAKLLFQPQFATLFGSGTRITTSAPDTLRVFDYQRAWTVLANPPAVSYKRFETACPSWDNSARAGARGVVLHGSTPQAYQQWLEQAIARAGQCPTEERIVFINAWNEWAEGCHLEPDKEFGRAYLEATRRALSGNGAELAPIRSIARTLERAL